MKTRALEKIGEPEKLAAVQRLKTNPAKVVSEARLGSLVDVHCLSYNLNLIPPVLLADTMRVFCTHLRTPDGFNPHKRLPLRHDKHSGLALMSIVGIGSMSRFVALEVDPTLSDTLTSNWPNLHAWIQYFYMERVSGEFPKVDGETRQTKELVLVTLCDALMTVSCDHIFFPKIVFDDGLLELVVNLWLKENAKANFSEIFKLRASDILNVCLLTAGSQNKLALGHEIILKEADGDTEKIATLALRHLRTVTKVNAEVITSLSSCVCILHYLVGHAESPFRTPVLAKDGAAIITRVFVYLSSVVGSEGLIKEQEVIAMENCVYFVFHGMLAHQSPFWTAKMVQSGLLEAIVKSCLINYSSRGIATIAAILRSLLPPHLVYYPVLGAVIGSMKSIESDASLVAKIRSSSFVKDWDYFSDIVFERAVLKAIFDQGSGIYSQCHCYYCKKTDEKENLKKCAGCRMAFYCSRDCQVNAWKLGNHREECKVMTAANHNVVYNADYTSVPSKLDVFRLEDFASERGTVLKSGVESLQMRRRYVQETRASKGKLILVSAIVPLGEFSSNLHFMVVHSGILNDPISPKDGSGEVRARRMPCCGPDRKDLEVTGGDEIDKAMDGVRRRKLRAGRVFNKNSSSSTVYDHIEDFVSETIKPAPTLFGVSISADAISKD
ncbi:hypothetical protein DFH11DRAFT_1745664 [Phellopilus nigrolimitatus]|nr:hypothetical protein DFH11DRAFT_1745664 [Phellopilus nigrolimitatus]